MPDSIVSFRGEYLFLSNFFPCYIRTANDGLFMSVEHAYQAAKSDDKHFKNYVRNLRTPHAAKKAGHHVECKSDWEAIKLSVMEDLVRRKFVQHKWLQKQLLATGTAQLIEGNSWGDMFWGVCRGKGDNNLGKLLMKIRGEINGGL